MKEKHFEDLGLDNGENLLDKFNLSELVEIDKKENDDEKEKKRKIKEIKKNV